ncbi:DUF1616 domain-containing protein [Chloroflexota bacterium]
MEFLFTIISSLILVLLTLFTPGALRIISGFTFVLFFPGYSLVAALFTRKTSLGNIERFALSFGLSIAVVPIIGLVLNYTLWGIRLYPIMISLFIFIVITASVAWYRRKKIQSGDRYETLFNLHFLSSICSRVPQGRWNKSITILLIIAIAGAIGTLIYTATSPNIGEKYTEFYVLGSDGQADDYPSWFALTDNEVVLVKYNEDDPAVSASYGTVTLGIVNREQVDTTYEIRLMVNSDEIELHFNGDIVEEIGPINLANDEKWEHDIGFAPKYVGDSQKVDFILCKDGEPYFRDPIHMWIDVESL